ncbi:hypothetical protein BCR41DRAFT_242503 [Lobosporangium transversale]|uniref:Uncharacterized protein n=1 Tax=Lobosporangium transversale TaxID=64571 RepID=A0A1Y2G5A8_9FUNG|nr:hypothetical protein BCR41DRAFT_242503 [Lobosporangium transversale]ORY94351.1 hypothetical protein BCR41DRAFT_242503 [Lobosporangium transversale]|eukprot:XP_021875291.1 hypothetical protein BCR41DRAFT_242503 [Lobosporangium transversale]
MAIPPAYAGTTDVLPENVPSIPYLAKTKIAAWSLTGFFAFTGQNESSFFTALNDINSFKGAPRDVRSFCKSILDFYSGIFGKEAIEIAKNSIKKDVNRSMMEGQEQLVLQSRVKNGLREELAKEQQTSEPWITAISTPITPTSTATVTASMDQNGEASTSKKPRSPTKRRKAMCATEEPWSSLTKSLMKIKSPSMNPLHAELFDHSVNMLKEYQGQSEQQKDITVVKDAQVAMSCVLNTLSKRACDHFDNYNNGSVLEEAIEQSLIEGFTEHPCQQVLKNYIPILEEVDVEDFIGCLKTDWGLLEGRKSKPPLPSELLEDKVIEILILLCKFITHPPFGTVAPSEMDCMHIWVSVFAMLTNKVTLHT